MKYFIYCRKSQEAEDRQVLSLESQAHEVAGIIKTEADIEIVDTFYEAFSAKQPGRPVFNEMLARIEKGDAQGIIAWHPDRLARNSMDGGQIIYLLDQGKLTDLKFANYSFENTSQGKFMLNIMFGQSKYYVDNLSENVMRGQRMKIEKQLWPSRAPNGYRFCDETKRILPDGQHFKMIRRIFEWFLHEEVSVAEIHRRLKDDLNYKTRQHKLRGGRTPSRSQIYHTLKNPVYAGYILWKGVMYPGKHKPVVSKTDFQKVQEKLGIAPTTRTKKRTFTYENLFRCGACGKAITAEYKRKPSGREYIYYHCTRVHTSPKCTQPSIEERQLYKELETYFEGFYLPRKVADYILNVVQMFEIDDRKYVIDQQERITEQIKELKGQISTLTDLRLRNALDDTEFDQRRSELQIKSDAAAEKLQNTSAEASKFEPAAIAVLLYSRARYWFREADNDLRRKLVQVLCSNPVLIDKKPIADTILPAKDITYLSQMFLQRGITSGVRTVPHSTPNVNAFWEKQIQKFYKSSGDIPKEIIVQMSDLIDLLDPTALSYFGECSLDNS